MTEPRFKKGDKARRYGDEVVVRSYDAESDEYNVTAYDPNEGEISLSAPRQELEEETEEWEDEDEQITVVEAIVGATVVKAEARGKFDDNRSLVIEFDDGTTLSVFPRTHQDLGYHVRSKS
jgi:hypothetical protein